MQFGLRALLTEALDYAGLFPPASLALDPAIRNFARDRQSSERWMLARFICPTGKLADLQRYRDELFAHEPPFRFSALGTGASDLDAFRRGLESDVQAMNAFVNSHDDCVRVEAFETRMPDALSREPSVALATAALECYSAAFDTSRFAGCSAFFEAPAGTSWQDGAEHLIRELGREGRRRKARGLPAPGFKLRTGGVTADAFPSTSLVAWALACCRDAVVPIKFTAGLHHPIRMYRDEVNTKMHGFVNVLAAAALAHAYPLDPLGERELEAVLECEDPRQFELHDDRILIGQYVLAADVITAIRRDAVISFGSCSFDEPIQDLRSLGWL